MPVLILQSPAVGAEDRKIPGALICALTAGLILGRSGKFGITIGLSVAAGWEMFRKKQARVPSATRMIKSQATALKGGVEILQSHPAAPSSPICELGCEAMSHSEAQGETVWFALIEPVPSLPDVEVSESESKEQALPASFFNDAPESPVETTEEAGKMVIQTEPENSPSDQVQPSVHSTNGVLSRMAAALKLVPQLPLKNVPAAIAKSEILECLSNPATTIPMAVALPEFAKKAAHHCLTPKAPVHEPSVSAV